MKLNLQTREKCCLFNDELEHLYTFKKFPIFMGCSDNDVKDDITVDMDWCIGRDNGFIQLKELIPLDILYSDSHGSGETGGIWDRHHKSFAEFINKFSPKSVFEIGGGHGILEINYQRYNNTPWTILEPNPKPMEGSKAKFINGFFTDNINLDFEYDTVVHSHVLEHIYDLNKFMSKLSSVMLDGKRLIFSLPNMHEMLVRKYTNCLNFEHTIFLTEPYIEFLLSKYGFSIEQKEYFLDDHSIFFSAIKTKTKMTNVKLTENLYDINKKTFNEFINYYQNSIIEINGKLNLEKEIYLFGAHIFSQYLLSFGLDADVISCILDNNKGKQGRRLYGTNLLVKSPSCLKDIDSPQVILKAGIYNNEIKSDILKNINSNVEFIE
tara:strand:+ start:2596 stop:3735 length:1140 start_codon:yes stop_codon:yes gene_type:complete